MFDAGTYSRAPSLGLAERSSRGRWGFLRRRRKSMASRRTHHDESSGGRCVPFGALRKPKSRINERLTALIVNSICRGHVPRNSH